MVIGEFPLNFIRTILISQGRSAGALVILLWMSSRIYVPFHFFLWQFQAICHIPVSYLLSILRVRSSVSIHLYYFTFEVCVCTNNKMIIHPEFYPEMMIFYFFNFCSYVSLFPTVNWTCFMSSRSFLPWSSHCISKNRAIRWLVIFVFDLCSCTPVYPFSQFILLKFADGIAISSLRSSIPSSTTFMCNAGHAQTFHGLVYGAMWAEVTDIKWANNFGVDILLSFFLSFFLFDDLVPGPRTTTKLIRGTNSIVH